ncbi:MAG: hypothetical protein CL868_05760 [Cytophagaceae bacterium]|nr:hypothetical protein [Cytophagaceae bacterium]
MKKSTILIFLFMGVTMLAQHPRERLEALKTAFITRELQLTAEEAKGFWPIYENYSSTLKELRRTQVRSLLSEPEKSEAAGEAFIEQYLTTEREQVNATEKLLTDLKGILPAYKRARLIVAEKQFGKHMLERIRDGRH